jgi:hypothetical protein
MINFLVKTKEDAINLHKQMWSDMLKHEKETQQVFTPLDKIRFKKEWCITYFGREISNNCILCEYAQYQLSQSNNQFEELDEKIRHCVFCPLSWGSNENNLIKGKSLCENNVVDWRWNSITQIIDLKEK